jgi:hypothetical protein
LSRGIARGGGHLIADNNIHETPHQSGSLAQFVVRRFCALLFAKRL